MKIVRIWLRRLTGVFRTFGAVTLPPRSRWFGSAAATATIVVVLVGAAATWRFSSDGLINAVDSLFGASESTQDDGAGDAPPSAGDGARYLPVPAALEDERVLAAVGPIANLTCKKDDYAKDAKPAVAPIASDLGPPLEDKGASAWIDRSATNAALSAGEGSANALSGPLSSPQFDVDDLLTRNLLAAGLSPIAALPAPDSESCPALLHYTFNKLQTGQPQSLCQFHGKVLLIVNTASYCAYTQQYEGLEAMYRKYRNRGLVVIGFPSNDFGKQEPGNNQQIAEFCRTTYGVQFPMFEKSSVAKLAANPLYMELAAKTGAAPQWNFHKYVVDRNGTPIASFASDVTPDSPQLVELIERLLAEKYAAKG
jgi:glutathione peroxidase